MESIKLIKIKILMSFIFCKICCDTNYSLPKATFDSGLHSLTEAIELFS